jgi:hypothetical protein
MERPASRPSTVKGVEMVESQEALKNAIAIRAYEIYIQRGGESGSDVEDWMQAEEELISDLAVAVSQPGKIEEGPSRSPSVN